MYRKLLPLLIVALCVSGCGHRKLADCQKQNQKLQADVTRIQQQLQDETAKHKADVDKVSAESKEMQTQAMQSMATMLKKDQDLQEKLKARIAELETQVKTQADQITKLNSSLAEMEKTAQAAVAIPAPAMTTAPAKK
jgi:predicted  nucleic acid-binding Zn-ribbon protein